MTEPESIAVLRRKLESLQIAAAKAVDPAMQFKIREDIAETEDMLAQRLAAGAARSFEASAGSPHVRALAGLLTEVGGANSGALRSALESLIEVGALVPRDGDALALAEAMFESGFTPFTGCWFKLVDAPGCASVIPPSTWARLFDLVFPAVCINPAVADQIAQEADLVVRDELDSQVEPGTSTEFIRGFVVKHLVRRAKLHEPNFLYEIVQAPVDRTSSGWATAARACVAARLRNPGGSSRALAYGLQTHRRREVLFVLVLRLDDYAEDILDAVKAACPGVVVLVMLEPLAWDGLDDGVQARAVTGCQSLGGHAPRVILDDVPGEAEAHQFYLMQSMLGD